MKTTNSLEVNYHQALISVTVDRDSGGALKINGLTRAQAPWPSAGGRLLLSSTVQTGYEWHEFIEASLSLQDQSITIELRASNAEIGRQEIPL